MNESWEMSPPTVTKMSHSAGFFGDWENPGGSSPINDLWRALTASCTDTQTDSLICDGWCDEPPATCVILTTGWSEKLQLRSFLSIDWLTIIVLGAEWTCVSVPSQSLTSVACCWSQIVFHRLVRWFPLRWLTGLNTSDMWSSSKTVCSVRSDPGWDGSSWLCKSVVWLASGSARGSLHIQGFLTTLGKYL